MNEEGVPIFPPSILEEQEDMDSLPFKAWVAKTPNIEVKPMSVPKESQPVPSLAHEGAVAPVPSVDLADD
ncbi:hypothetical protein SLEP1_g3745 [Rubroshorea leprosula]|uniref:Uncharacterized protein n=1 Tax=Rubroshorea leprosula TaxID=152421 RepID=A0AAV5HW36_9ROSI|nr:hypothetical protein SLEP1_g3745 [Rubroshorea leprosula]